MYVRLVMDNNKQLVMFLIYILYFIICIMCKVKHIYPVQTQNIINSFTSSISNNIKYI